MKRIALLTAAVGLGSLGLLPPVVAQEDPPALGPPKEAQAPLGGFHGFSSFQTRAQGQVGEVTGYLNAFREDNRVVGALSEINGPPANSRNITAFLQRGEAATFVYGVIGGGGGERGTLPDPPPGEANAFYPSEPFEMTWTGPITAVAQGQVIDSRFHAKATDTPTGRAEGTVTRIEVRGYSTAEAATVVSHTEPADGGVRSESVSVLRQVTSGPLVIETLVSRAMAFVPAAAGAEPVGIASTVVQGATVNDVPVKVTDQGVVAADNENPMDQEQINAAFAEAGFEQVRLLPSTAEPGQDGTSVVTLAGAIEIIKHDEAFGASNPQGFSGGGFSIGGAEASIRSVRCAPDCPLAGELGVPPDPIPSDGSLTDGPESSPASPAPPPEPNTAENVAPEPLEPSYDTTPLDTPDDGGGYDGGFSGSTGGGIALGEEPAGDAGDSSSVAVTPSPQQAAPAVAGQAEPTALASSLALGPEEAGWVRDLYLGLGAGVAFLFIAQRLARSFSPPGRPS